MESLWEFSVRTYGREGVAQACLGLQDGRGADVNLLLMSCWLAEHGDSWSPDLLTDVVEWSAQWRRAVIKPLRSVRRWMKTPENGVSIAPDAPGHGLREQVKAAELAAERLQLETLEEMVQGVAGRDAAQPVPARDLQAQNLRAVIQAQGLQVSEDELLALVELLK